MDAKNIERKPGPYVKRDMNPYQYEKLVLNDTAQVWCSNNVIWKYVLNSMTINI